MIRLAIELNAHASIQDALLSMAKSLNANYGAGTLTNPHRNRDYVNEDFLGFWTASPESWDGEAIDIAMTFTFPNQHKLYHLSSSIADLARTFKGEKSGEVKDWAQGVIGTFQFFPKTR